MFTTYEITRVLVVDRQQRALGEASAHRLVRAARRARRSMASAGGDQPAAAVHHLPARVTWPDRGEERAAG